MINEKYLPGFTVLVEPKKCLMAIPPDIDNAEYSYKPVLRILYAGIGNQQLGKMVPVP
jgi:hypothetical protein